MIKNKICYWNNLAKGMEKLLNYFKTKKNLLLMSIKHGPLILIIMIAKDFH